MTQKEEAGIVEQTLNKAVEIGLSSQLNAAERLEIDIHGELLQLVQGEADSVTLQGKGIVTPQDLRLEELELQTGSIAINLLSSALGKIKLNHPADASVRIVVTTADLNRALNSNFFRSQLRNVDIPVKNQGLRIELQQAECHLPGNGRFVFKAKLLTHLSGQTQSVAFQAVLKSRAGGQCISFVEGGYLEGKDLPVELTAALLTKVSELLNLRDFQYENISLHLKQLEVEVNQVTLWLKTYII